MRIDKIPNARAAFKKMIPAVALFLCAQRALAQSAAGEGLRAFSPDRPHQTESPITTDIHHFIFETDFVNFSTGDPAATHSVGFLYFNAKYGLGKRMDVGLMSNAYRMQFLKPGTSLAHSLLPDLTFRYKYNLIGNDSGKLAVGLMPLVTTSNFVKEKFHVLSEGLMVNGEYDFNERFGLGCTTGVNFYQDSTNRGQKDFFATVSFDYKILGKLRQFVEGSYRYGPAQCVDYSVDTGFTLSVAKDWQLDCGTYYYIPERKLFAFVGGSVRI